MVGKYLLQRNLVKFAIPLVGVPLSTGANYWITRTAGVAARDIFRNEARVIEAARRTCSSVDDHEALLWVMWLVIAAEPRVADNERLLLHHVARIAATLGGLSPQAGMPSSARSSSAPSSSTATLSLP